MLTVVTSVEYEESGVITLWSTELSRDVNRDGSRWMAPLIPCKTVIHRSACSLLGARRVYSLSFNAKLNSTPARDELSLIARTCEDIGRIRTLFRVIWQLGDFANLRDT